MGHIVGGGFLKAITKEEAMREGYADACRFTEYNVDREENPSGSYDNSFKFYDKVFNTEEEAEAFFYSLGSYSDGVCMVKEAGQGAKNRYAKKILSIRNKEIEFTNKVIEKFKERTSKSIGCKKCGTRVSSEIALSRKLKCPNCGDWLVNDTTKQRFAKFSEQRRLADEQLAKDTAETGKARYWVKYEVHC